jgi:hypothetical protein
MYRMGVNHKVLDMQQQDSSTGHQDADMGRAPTEAQRHKIVKYVNLPLLSASHYFQ